jgi:glycosyltransferase involved in cell wall biosynthesis
VIDRSVEQLARFEQLSVDILVIDDGSRDNTAELARDGGARVITNVQNVGLGRVFEQAVAYATEAEYDYMISIDGDGQFSEADIPALLAPLLEDEADCVTGSRFLDQSTTVDIPLAKRLGNFAVAKMVSSVLGSPMQDVSCGFRAYSKMALHHLNLFGGYTYTQKVLLNLGYKNVRIREVPITTKYFKTRQSRIAHNLFSYGWGVLKIILSSMLFYRPTRLFGSIALVLFVVALPPAGLSVFHYLTTGSITPYKAAGIIAIVLLVLSLGSLVFGLIMQSVSRLQLSLDRLLYYQRRNKR